MVPLKDASNTCCVTVSASIPLWAKCRCPPYTALTGLSGAVVGQYQRTVDMGSGTGIVVIGLACLIIGETVAGRRGMGRGILAVMAGSIIYRFIYAIVFYTKVVPVDCLKLLTAAVVALAIAAPTLRAGAGLQKRKLAAGRKEGR